MDHSPLFEVTENDSEWRLVRDREKHTKKRKLYKHKVYESVYKEVMPLPTRKKIYFNTLGRIYVDPKGRMYFDKKSKVFIRKFPYKPRVEFVQIEEPK